MPGKKYNPKYTVEVLENNTARRVARAQGTIERSEASIKKSKGTITRSGQTMDAVRKRQQKSPPPEEWQF